MRYNGAVPSSASLFRAELYVAQLERLRAKFKAKRRSREPDSGGVTLSALHDRGSQLCEHVAAEVTAGSYRFSPLQRVSVRVDGKLRTIHRANLVDALVLGAMAQRLTALLEAALEDTVYAYRPQRNPQLAIARVRECLRAHHAARPNPRDRGLFVLQRDLAAYGESIPTAADSRLWTLLDEVLGAHADRDEARRLRALLDAACRPEVKLPSGEIVQLGHGLPTGSPIQQPLANLYLIPLDRALKGLGPHHYARFGDDLLVLEPELDRACSAAATIDAVVSDLGLSFSTHKSRDLYFTKPGRPLGAATPITFTPTSHVEYLGVRLSFDGHQGLKRKRLRQFLTRSKARIANTKHVAPPEQVLEFVAEALNEAIHGTTSVADAATVSLRTWVDDRQQLRHLDYWLARACAEAVSGKRGVRAFRHTPPQAIRDAGLHSLLELRKRSEGER